MTDTPIGLPSPRASSARDRLEKDITMAQAYLERSGETVLAEEVAALLPSVKRPDSKSDPGFNNAKVEQYDQKMAKLHLEKVVWTLKENTVEAAGLIQQVEAVAKVKSKIGYEFTSFS